MSKQTDLINVTDAITVSGSNVGIGTSSPSSLLDVDKSQNAETNIELTNTNVGSAAQVRTKYTTDGGLFTVGKVSDAHAYSGAAYLWNVDNTNMLFATNDTERMRIDSSGNLLVGNTSFNHENAGAMLASNGRVYSTVDGNFTFTANRLSSDGEIIRIQKDTTTVGSIGNASSNSIYIAGNTQAVANLAFGGSSVIYPTNDNVGDIGAAFLRFDDIYATNGSIQTSDRNEKQDIEVLSDAEQRVAVACKGLLRKFRWQDAVAEKGDDARIHFGIIAQDLQDAFAAEGLDAGRYAMFISSTWWETQTEVPAVEAVAEVLDDDGNVVTEAVEAKEAYTRTDTYETQAEAPEGATERTRLGVRYPELLAFIIGAM